MNVCIYIYIYTYVFIYIHIYIYITLSTAMKFASKFFRKWSFFEQNQQPLYSVEPFERIFRALLISQCPYKFSSFLDLRNASKRFRLFSRDFWLFRFFFSGSACFSKLTPTRNLPSWAKYHGKFESFEKEFRRSKFIAVERIIHIYVYIYIYLYINKNDTYIYIYIYIHI